VRQHPRRPPNKKKTSEGKNTNYNQSNDFVGDELSLHPLKLENVSESPSAESLPLSPLSETFWLSPTREEEKEFATQNRIKEGGGGGGSLIVRDCEVIRSSELFSPSSLVCSCLRLSTPGT